VVLPNVVIGRNVQLRRAIIDKRCVLPDGFRAGGIRCRTAHALSSASAASRW